VFQYSADGIQRFLGYAGIFVAGKERFIAVPDAAMGMHTAPVVFKKWFGHECYGMAIFMRYIFKHVLEPHELVAHFNKRFKTHINLGLTGGAPLKALAIAAHFSGLEEQMTGLLDALLGGRAEVTRIAGDMLGEGLPARLDWLEAWLGQAVRAQALPDGTDLTVPGGPLLQRAAAEVNITAAFRILDRLRESRRLLEGNAAPQLLVEALLIELKAAIRRRGVA